MEKETYSFGEWFKQRRKALRFTQKDIAASAFCSIAMIKKIEADARRPSVELAQALASILQIPSEQHDVFTEVARGIRPLDHIYGSHALAADAQTSASLSTSIQPSTLPVPSTPFIGRKVDKRFLREIDGAQKLRFRGTLKKCKKTSLLLRGKTLYGVVGRLNQNAVISLDAKLTSGQVEEPITNAANQMISLY